MKSLFILLVVCLLVAYAAEKPNVRPPPNIRPPIRPIPVRPPPIRPPPRPLVVRPPPMIPGRGKRAAHEFRVGDHNKIPF